MTVSYSKLPRFEGFVCSGVTKAAYKQNSTTKTDFHFEKHTHKQKKEQYLLIEVKISTLPWLTNASSPTPNQPHWQPQACTLQICPLTYAYLLYDPNLAGIVLFLTIFALHIPAQLLLGYNYGTPGFTCISTTITTTSAKILKKQKH